MTSYRIGIVCLAVALAFLPNVAWPLILANPSDRSTVKPLDDPGWDNVGDRSNGSAVYLGNRWILTANHVGAGPVLLLNTVYQAEAGTELRLFNTPSYRGLSTSSDLLLYRLTTDPGLPSLAIGETSVSLLHDVTMIGFGRTRAGDTKYWDLNWQEVNEAQKSVYRGFQNGVTGKLWGTNRVVLDGTTRDTTRGDTVGLRTVFDRIDPAPNEAQAASGDSGGGVFSKRGETWELAGIMLSISDFQSRGQPAATTVFGSTTAFADVSGYRSQIESFVTATPWQNTDPLNVNGDDIVSPLDALAIFNELNNPTVSNPETSSLPILGPRAASDFFYDVNGDNYVTPLDALLVINRINESAASVAAMTLPDVTARVVPEPASLGLLAHGLIWLAAAAAATGSWRRCGRF